MNRIYQRLNQTIDSVTPRKILWFAIIAFIVYFSFVAFARHDNFYSRRLDLGNMDQTVWNVLHGNGFTLTDPMGAGQESRLAVHADFLMVLMAPLYMLWSNPKMLVLVQTIVVCLGALPLFWIAADKLKSQKLALLFALGYLLYPPLQRMMLHDFHAVALSTTFLLFAYWYMTKEQYGPFVVSAVLAGLGKEHIWITIGLMGVYVAIRNKRVLSGLVIAVVGFAMFYYLFWHAIPAVTPTKQHFALQYLSDFGDNQNTILKHILGNPVSVLRTMILPDRLWYYAQLLIPVAFLPLLAPWVLVFSAHSWVINALSTNNLMRQIDYQYTSDITPFLFVAAIEGFIVIRSFILRNVAGRKRKRLSGVVAGILVTAIAASVIVWGELPLGIQSRFLYFISPQPEKAMMEHVEASIPSVYTVSATNNIGAHFSEREFLYNFPVNALSADYAVAMLGDQYAWPSGDAQRQAVDQLLKSTDYTLIAHQGNFYAFKKNIL